MIMIDMRAFECIDAANELTDLNDANMMSNIEMQTVFRGEVKIVSTDIRHQGLGVGEGRK